MKIDGTVDLDLVVEGVEIRHRAVVSPDVPYPVLVGRDVLVGHGVVLDPDVGSGERLLVRRKACALCLCLLAAGSVCGNSGRGSVACISSDASRVGIRRGSGLASDRSVTDSASASRAPIGVREKKVVRPLNSQRNESSCCENRVSTSKLYLGLGFGKGIEEGRSFSHPNRSVRSDRSHFTSPISSTSSFPPFGASYSSVFRSSRSFMGSVPGRGAARLPKSGFTRGEGGERLDPDCARSRGREHFERRGGSGNFRNKCCQLHSAGQLDDSSARNSTRSCERDDQTYSAIVARACASARTVSGRGERVRATVRAPPST